MNLRVPIVFLFAATLCGQTPPPNAAPASKDAADSKPATLSGKVTSSAGQPLKKTTLTLRSMAPPPTGQAMPNPYTASSNAEGNFIFEAIEPGRYMLSAERPGYQRQSYGARRSGNMNPGTTLDVKAGQTMATLNIVMSPQITISGKVLDADGDPVARAQIRVTRNMYYTGALRQMPVGYANTDDNGEYKVQSLGPGKYYIAAYPARNNFFQSARSAAPAPATGQPAKRAEVEVTTYYPGVIDPSSANAIELVTGHDHPATDITLHKAQAFRITGKASGQLPVDRAQLRVVVVSRSSYFIDFQGQSSSPLGKGGEFDLAQVPPGSYNLMLVTINGMMKTLAMAPLDIGSQDVSEVTLIAATPFELSGQVKADPTPGAVDDPAKPKTSPLNATINLNAIDGPMWNNPTAQTDENGSFKMTDLSGGHYRLNASSRGDDTYVKSVKFADQDVLRDGLNLPAGGTTTQLEIVFGANAAKVNGTVQDAEGKPAPSATLTLLPDPPAPNRTDLYHQITTDKDGVFNLKGIAPGKYRIYAWEELENGNQYDPDFIKNFETKGTKIELQESAAPQVTLTWIKQ